ncbi:MAG: hypothetical protein ACJ795_19900 [Ktedonobacteraceae bacterium]
MADNEEEPKNKPVEAQKDETVRVELAESGNKSDPVSSVENAQLRSLSDVYRHHAEILDEQRGQHEGLKQLHGSLKDLFDQLGASVREWQEFVMQEKARAEEQRPPVGGKPKKPFGGPGF